MSKEQQGYLTCLGKIKPGTKVKIYVDDEGYSSARKTIFTRTVMVVGIDSSGIPLLGVTNNGSCPGFYPINKANLVRSYHHSLINNIGDYMFFYKAVLHDVKIASVVVD